MYQLTIRSSQVLSACLVHVSICEIGEDGRIVVLATATTTADCVSPDSMGVDLADFLAGTMHGISQALATP